MPGGIGRTLGKAKRKISAARARPSIRAMISRMVMVVRLSSAAMAARISDRRRPGTGLSGGAVMAAQQGIRLTD